MKPQLQSSLNQQLVMSPQLQQAIRLLQMSTVELEVEIAQAIESNPLLEWEEDARIAAEASAVVSDSRLSTDTQADYSSPLSDVSQTDYANTENDHSSDHASVDSPEILESAPDWPSTDDGFSSNSGGSFDDDDKLSAIDRMVQEESLMAHLSWQLHLSPLSEHDQYIGTAIIGALEDDGYLRDSLADIARLLPAHISSSEEEIHSVLLQIQQFDPIGVAARSIEECLSLQLKASNASKENVNLALKIVNEYLERLPKLGVEGIARELKCSQEQAKAAVQLIRSLDPRPGKQVTPLDNDTYVIPDCVVWRDSGKWRVALSSQGIPKVGIHKGYEQMIDGCAPTDASYLKGHLQEARSLLKNIKARGDTLLKVMECLIQHQAAFLDYGEQALRPLTLQKVAEAIGMHESTISRTISRKYVRTPRGTLPLRVFFASGVVDGEQGEESSSTAIQAMIKRLIDAEDPRKPLSDSKLTDLLKAAGMGVARRTVAKYREGMNIPSSTERVRIN